MGVNCSPDNAEDQGSYDGESDRKYPSYAEIYKLHRKQLPIALAMGMTPHQFWDEEVTLFWAYEKANRIKRRQEDAAAWMQGFYNGRAFADVLSAAFAKKGQKHESVYPKKPVFTDDPERAEKKKRITKPSEMSASEKERKLIAEEIRDRFRALNDATNAALLEKQS